MAENKTLPGREDRTYDGEAMGRKLAVVFFEDMDRGLVRRVHRDTTGMHQILLTIAEILLTLGVTLPEDHERSAADSECLLEAEYENLTIASCTQRNEDLLDGETLYKSWTMRDSRSEQP